MISKLDPAPLFCCRINNPGELYVAFLIQKMGGPCHGNAEGFKEMIGENALMV
jgi:hypothetical protein